MAFTFVYTPPTGMGPLAAPILGAAGHLTHHEGLEQKINNLNTATASNFTALATQTAALDVRLAALEGRVTTLEGTA